MAAQPNFYQPELTANATAEDIVGEISFVEILKISVLENPTPHSQLEIDHLDDVLLELERRLHAAEGIVQQSIVPASWQGDNWNGHGHHNGLSQADLGGDFSSPHTPLDGPVSGSASSSHLDGGEVLTSTPLGTPAISLKRSRTVSTNHNGPSHSASKRQSNNPSPSTTSPQSPIYLGDDDSASDNESEGAFQIPSLKKEPALLAPYRRNDQQYGVGMPRQLPHPGRQHLTPSKVENRPTPGFSSRLPTRPHVPQRSLSQLSSTAATSSSAMARGGIPPIKHEVGTSDHPWNLLDDLDEVTSHSPFQANGNSSNGSQGRHSNSIRFGQSTSLGLSNGNTDSKGHRHGYAPPHHEETIDLTGDSPPDSTHDDPIMTWASLNNHRDVGSSSNTGHRSAFAPDAFSTYGDMPGAFPKDNFLDLDAAYTGQQINNSALRGQYTRAPAYLNNGDHFANTDLQIGSFETTDWMTEASFADLAGLNPDGSLLGTTPTLNPFLPPQNPHQALLARMGLGELEDDLSLRNPEELKKLLENIRPDEDLPPELREQTPKAMDVTLMEHQKLGLTWLKKMEEGSNKGGILADDMGLGKTIQALSLILARPSDDPLRKTTLIIAPVALMRQWEAEIKNKVKAGHRLRVHVYHGAGKKCNFNKLRQNDVVLTTFGTLGQEFKKKEELLRRMAGQQEANLAILDDLPLVGEKCKWYRIIIDEAQCIKNKSTLNARAAMALQSTYRFCMTGTPMMNSVVELYSLIKFLRIGPYDEWSRFNNDFARPIKSNSERDRSRAMKRLQILLKAILLRRTKTSVVDEKPIIQIPPKHVHQVEVTFSADELEIYKSLENKTQLTFNKYLKKKSVANNYANILVLLLRLRQACCHPHLINDLSVNTSVQDIPEEHLRECAAQLSEDVVNRLKGHEGEGFECPVCYDAVVNPTIFIPCGHNTCSECFTKLLDPQRAIQAGDDRAQARCPECRNEIRSNKITDFKHFLKVHMPEELPDDEEEDGQDNGETDSDSDSESDEDVDDETLGGFIVPDEDEGVPDNEQSEEATKPQVSKGKASNSKGKGKAKKTQGDKPKKMKKKLAQLKKESLRNKAAKEKYIRRLKHNWVTSAKTEKTVQLLQEIEANDPSEKTIIFSQFTSLLDLLEVPLSEKKVKYQRYDGSMKSSERVEAVNQFMDTATCQVMLISLKAGNAGLNLNKASHVIILDPFWNPYIEDQAVDRAHRMMQKRNVHVHRLLVPGTVEDRILHLQERKRDMISQALDEAAGKSISRLGVQELGFLFGVNGL